MIPVHKWDIAGVVKVGDSDVRTSWVIGTASSYWGCPVRVTCVRREICGRGVR